MKRKGNEVTAREMFDEAARRTQNSSEDARREREAEWDRQIALYRGEKSDYAEYGVFKDAGDYFVAREQDILKGGYPARDFIMRVEAEKILSFNFNYDYVNYGWDERTYDLDGDTAFDGCSESDELASANLKRDVVCGLRRFLLTGAVLAKKIGSDTYVRWRKLIADLDYTYDFFERGAGEGEAEAFLKSVDEAAELYVVDAEVSARLDMTTGHEREKRPRKRGGGQARRI